MQICRQGIVVVEHEATLEEQVIAKAITDIGYPAKVVVEKELTQRPGLFKDQGAGYGCCGGGGEAAAARHRRQHGKGFSIDNRLLQPQNNLQNAHLSGGIFQRGGNI